jgi:DNA-binding NarL/FixJ family response regulator
VRAHCPKTVTVVFTAHERDVYLAKMIEAGPAGFLTKNEDEERLVEMIRCAARGKALPFCPHSPGSRATGPGDRQA